MPVPFYTANILLPREGHEKWSVIACDQYTSDPGYWAEVDKLVGESPSTLRITLPELFLGEPDVDKRVEKINDTMEKYLDSGIFEEIKNTFVYVERSLKSDITRYGIVGAVDLEAYDFTPGSQTLIRATEKTVAERIPPRVKIRENAPLELPHIMILIDDPADAVIGPIKQMKPTMKKLYDFDLIKNGGHIVGWKADGVAASELTARLESHLKRCEQNTLGKPPLLFAMGDGNHSLATAKTCWERIKPTLTDEEKAVHPARFALAEIVNLHDESLEFEPIHRVIFGTDTKLFISEMKKYFDGRIIEDNCDVDDFNDFVAVSEDFEHVYEIASKENNLTVGDVQDFLDYYVKCIDTNAKIDYIHGDGAAIDLGRQSGNIALLMPYMPKNELFATVMLDGVLPRKTFSMGEADDKRFYLEAKKIK